MDIKAKIEEIVEKIKADKNEICNQQLALYRTYGIQSVESDIATAYVKSECEIKRHRLTPAQIIAMYDYNPSAFNVTDKAVRDSIKIAQLAKANGDVSEGVQCLLDIDLDKLRGPVKHTAIVGSYLCEAVFSGCICLHFLMDELNNCVEKIEAPIIHAEDKELQAVSCDVDEFCVIFEEKLVIEVTFLNDTTVTNEE